jgi:DnaK suppressor protein
MIDTETNTFKTILEAKRAELTEALRRRDGIAIEKSADQLDEVQRAAERELVFRNLDRESNLLRHVRAALGRIQDGTFGICLHCEEEISARRLKAIPWTPLCIRCQESADHSDNDGPLPLESSLLNAA